MYLNISAAANASNVEGSCSTPRTPEILNLLAGAPFENAPRPGASTSRAQINPQATCASTPGEAPCSPREHASFSPGSSLSSPATPGTPSGLPSIQNARTYLIKEGLKLTIQSKRLASGRTPTLEEDPLLVNQQTHKEELTPEDEERRRRRRERNKLAATKCRNRKKERTGVLLQESGTLEGQNVTLRSEIQKLEAEKRRLMEVLSSHSSSCVKAGSTSAPVTIPSSSSFMTDATSHYTSYPVTLPARGPPSASPCQSYDFTGLAVPRTSPAGGSFNTPGCSNMYDCRATSGTPMSSHPQQYDVGQCVPYSSDSYAMNSNHHMPYDGSSQTYR